MAPAQSEDSCSRSATSPIALLPTPARAWGSGPSRGGKHVPALAGLTPRKVAGPVGHHQQQRTGGHTPVRACNGPRMPKDDGTVRRDGEATCHWEAVWCLAVRLPVTKPSQEPIGVPREVPRPVVQAPDPTSSAGPLSQVRVTGPIRLPCTSVAAVPSAIYKDESWLIRDTLTISGGHGAHEAT